MSILSRVFGTKNQRELKKLLPAIQQINELRPKLEAKSDAQLRDMTVEFRQRLDNGATLDDLLPEAFAVVREAAWRTLKMRHFDVQLMGGMVLHQGKIAEMRTGEGKTLTATLPVYLNALEGRGVHVVTVNDYLARRDAEWMGQIYGFLGMSTGVIVHGLEDWQRQKNYRCDISYGQNNEFGFDYLRDNMKMSPDRMVQRGSRYALVDEVDSILIDEARTPLIISGPSEESADLYTTVDRVVPRLKRDVDYTVDEKAHAVMLTDQGVERVEKLLGLKNLYDPANIAYNHHVAQALRAHTLYKRDVNYLIDEGKILIIDEFTGRKMPGRRWSDGLHQAIEAKEGVDIEEENQTLATITFQNFFRMYDKLAGMTGTADTEAAEFHHIYKLEVVVVPTNKPMIRDDMPDLVYKNEKGKFRAVIDDIADCHKRGQPVLVGTTSVEKSEVVASLLKKEQLRFDVLNAKQHEREAGIVAQAGRRGAITISTNMAGRGTDIILGGNAEYMAKEMMKAEGRASEPGQYEILLEQLKGQCDKEREDVLKAGGLKIIGTERHESRRIDNQLRGRAGRQGDPGESRFFLSAEDDLVRLFAGDRIYKILDRLGPKDDSGEEEPIEAKMLTKQIEGAQRKVEEQNYLIRKRVLEYDDVMNQQREVVYKYRDEVLEGRDMADVAREQVGEVIGRLVDEYTPGDFADDWDLEELWVQLDQMYHVDFEIGDLDRSAIEREELKRMLSEDALSLYDEREQELGEELMRVLERYLILQIIDQRWREHLYDMDYLREGIHLRGFAQIEPLVAYKNEAFTLFEDLMNSIWADFARMIYNVEVEVQGPDEEQQAPQEWTPAPQQPQSNFGALEYSGGTFEDQPTAYGDPEDGSPQEPPVVAQRRVAENEAIGRNDPCWCGSGKKFKKCHGA
jgi:preprotein translocase subunit SecA